MCSNGILSDVDRRMVYYVDRERGGSSFQTF
jgi:hypothetical protein